MMYVLRKIVSRCLFPVPLCLFFLLTGLAYLLFSQRKRKGVALIAMGAGLLLLFSCPPFPDYLLSRLEQQYPPLLKPEWESKDPPMICVLGQSIYTGQTLTPNGRFNEDMVSRLVEGARLQRLLAGSKLAVSVPGAAVSEEAKMATLASFFGIFGIAASQIQIIGNARDTVDEIREFKALAGTNTVFLVSSASHLTRASIIARKHQLNVIPAPCGFRVDPGEAEWQIADLIPNSGNLRNSERAMYEHLGLLWEEIKGE